MFVLCTGRSGSAGFYYACKHIENFSSGHESLAIDFDHRLEFDQDHIEIDNRLSWFLGSLDVEYGAEPIYVHLIRDKEATVNSFLKRWSNRGGIISAFSEGILKTPPEKLSLDQKRKVCELYYDTVNQNIEFFLESKPNKMTIELENVQTGFRNFWERIGATGNLEAALKEFEVKHNDSNSLKSDFLYKIKLFIKRTLNSK